MTWTRRRPLAALVAALLLAAVASLALMGCSGGDDDDDSGGDNDRTEASVRWATDVCSIVGDFIDGIGQISSRFPENPSSQALDKRKADDIAKADAIIKASDAAASLLAKSKAPSQASKYHATLIAQFKEISRVLGEQRTAARNATSVSQLEALTTRLNDVLDETDAAVADAYDDLPGDFQTAIEDVPECENDG